MLLAVLSGFLLAFVAPWLAGIAGRYSGWLLALLPAGLTLWFASFLPEVAANGPIFFAYPWVPGLDVGLTFYLDGLSLLFALLIAGIGTFIVIYAGGYLADHPDLRRFYVVLLAFMASMLGLVLSSNLIALFVFWELTSITSYLLIGFDHEDEKARKAALQGLIVTVGGGLALMAGLVLLAMAGGSYELAELLHEGDAIRDHALYLPLLLLILFGAFTKSAQVPFHFWLPNAMAAPTPVSAYLHSATMVKAGVYLLARLNPSLGGTDAWLLLLSLFGALTMFTGAVMAIRSTGVKRMLAYSTVMALGTLTLLIGLGTPTAAAAAVTFLLAHSLYKGALFLIAGILDHETGCKDFRDLGGLRGKLPVTAAVAALAALSLAGILPLFGFVAKELLFESVIGAPWIVVAPVALLALASAVLIVAAAAVVGIRPYFGPIVPTPKHPHEAPPALLAGPVTLAALGLLFGLYPALAEHQILAAAAQAVHGAPVELNLALWHGFNLPLLMSLVSLGLGLWVFSRWELVRARFDRYLEPRERFGPERGYELFMEGIVRISDWQTRLLQNGYLRYYILTIVITLVALTGYTLLTRYPVVPTPNLAGIEIHLLAVALMIVLAALFAIITHSRLGAVALLGAVGFGVALVFILFSAPDVGITQVLVETLTVILLVLVIFRLPDMFVLSRPRARYRDSGVAVALGGLLVWLLLLIQETRFFPSISAYFIENSQPLAHGRNIVNVILVDFRALDTLGEITVLALAAVGVYAMIKLRAEDRQK